jgi:prepilin-type N-terminal cleavage/methylation domain-containing protein
MANTNKQTGFTIVELLITIALFAILVPSIASFMNFLTTLNSRARTISTINAMAENKLESIRSAGYLATPVASNVSFAASEIPASIPSPKSAKYTVSTTSDPSVRKLTISISYNNHGTQETLNYATYLGQLGVGQY